jgi:hypothetical protein
LRPNGIAEIAVESAVPVETIDTEPYPPLTIRGSAQIEEIVVVAADTQQPLVAISVTAPLRKYWLVSTNPAPRRLALSTSDMGRPP